MPHTLLHHPQGPLARFVACLWSRRGAGEGCRRLSLPTGGADLTINLHPAPLQVFDSIAAPSARSFQSGVMHGPQSRYFVLGARAEVHTIGVHFHPGGAALLGVRGDALTDAHAPLEAALGAQAFELHERLLKTTNPRAQLEIVERALLDRLAHAQLANPVVSFALRRLQTVEQPMRIAALQAESGFSARRFNTLFCDRIGLPPKTFARIARLRSVVERAARAPVVRWAEIAQAFGYCDQAHLTHEFRALTGVTPSEYRPESPVKAVISHRRQDAKARRERFDSEISERGRLSALHMRLTD